MKIKTAKTVEKNHEVRFVTKKVFESNRENGVREQAQSVIPKKGATLSQICAAAKKQHGLAEKRTRSYINWLAAKKYVARISA